MSEFAYCESRRVDRTVTILAAAFTCTIWDHALTLNDELEYVWKRKRWSVSIILFLLNRYGNEVALLYVLIFGDALNILQRNSPVRYRLVIHNALTC